MEAEGGQFSVHIFLKAFSVKKGSMQIELEVITVILIVNILKLND